MSRVRIPSPAFYDQKGNNENCRHLSLSGTKYERRVLDTLLLQKSISFYIDSLYAEAKSPRTITIYSYNLEIFLHHLGDMKIKSLSAVDVRSFLAGRAHGREASTVHQAFRVLRSFFNWTVREGFLEKTPMANIKAPRVPRKIKSTYNREEIQAMLSLCNEKRFIGARNKAIISILLDSGIREGELIGLDLNNIDFRSGIMKVKGKGNKERIVHISDKARKALWKYMLLRDSRAGQETRLFLSEEARPLTGNGVCEIIRKLGLEAGVRAKIHKFRDTCAVEFLRNGGDIKVLQNMLGHTDIATTALYLTSIDGDDVVRKHMQFSPGDKFL